MLIARNLRLFLTIYRLSDSAQRFSLLFQCYCVRCFCVLMICVLEKIQTENEKKKKERRTKGEGNSGRTRCCPSPPPVLFSPRHVPLPFSSFSLLVVRCCLSCCVRLPFVRRDRQSHHQSTHQPTHTTRRHHSAAV